MRNSRRGRRPVGSGNEQGALGRDLINVPPSGPRDAVLEVLFLAVQGRSRHCTERVHPRRSALECRREEEGTICSFAQGRNGDGGLTVPGRVEDGGRLGRQCDQLSGRQELDGGASGHAQLL